MCGMATFTMLVSTSSSTLAERDRERDEVPVPVDLRAREPRRPRSGRPIDGHVRVYRVRIVTSTDMPGPQRMRRRRAAVTAIRTGTRCTTLVKLPVALSGGSSAKRAPVAGLSALDRAPELPPGIGVDGELDRVADRDVLAARSPSGSP